jgi:hypothetical protein
MKKIPTLFLRDYTNPRNPVITDKITPGCEWVLEGKGIATRKVDGTCTKLDEGGNWWARREVKPGKPVPDGFVEEEIDPVTEKMVGFEPMEQSSFLKAFKSVENKPIIPATYELCGPKVNGNPEGYTEHYLIQHGQERLTAPAHEPLDLIAECREHGYEGVVWWSVDGTDRKCKLKVRDYA